MNTFWIDFYETLGLRLNFEKISDSALYHKRAKFGVIGRSATIFDVIEPRFLTVFGISLLIKRRILSYAWKDLRTQINLFEIKRKTQCWQFAAWRSLGLAAAIPICRCSVRVQRLQLETCWRPFTAGDTPLA